MMENSLPETNAALALLMREKLGVRGADRLEVKLRRAGGLLPRALRKDAKYLVDMEKLYDNPKLRRQIDSARVSEASANLRRHLEAIDPRDRRIGWILGVVAPLAFNLLLIAAAFITWLVWTGRV
ncbi:hypothetical protein [Tropicimonas sediminicola]|uniref:Uncharacterized protein n=1 Tax=Tropicimonas sediminicola TaxID=1031541 RepID=A0A239CS21_9RHOB|nr:hypothetical protein [Tropicimonas sediminicola]SNS22173.1 hypothetical protein SAMN05421757_101411 [Tropicimonas sediminicola]